MCCWPEIRDHILHLSTEEETQHHPANFQFLLTHSRGKAENVEQWERVGGRTEKNLFLKEQ